MDKTKQDQSLSTADEVKIGLEVLKKLFETDPLLLNLSSEDRTQFVELAGRLSRPSKDQIIARNKALRKERRSSKKILNRSARKTTGIRSAREKEVFTAPLLLEAPVREQLEQKHYASPHDCYVCKSKFTKVHHFYDSMCESCAELNYQKRFQLADLTGQVALITGSRLKIGYHITLMLLRAGAKVIATTRFPVDSALRFSKESDFPIWADRLQVYGLDLRHTPSVDIFARFVETNYERLDIIINNAAQTVRRPSGFYAHLLLNEKRNPEDLPLEVGRLLEKHFSIIAQLGHFSSNNKNLPVAWQQNLPGLGIRASAELSQIPYSIDDTLVSDEIFPIGKLDADLQQVDLRKTNSWRLRLGEIPIEEMLEVQLVNSVAPFVLINRLVTLMRKEYTGMKHIVNVSAMEGKFHRFKKEDRHPHTNMAKAALNMMTHTSALDFAKDGIYMNAVDTGWVTDEDPADLSLKKQEEHDFQPPLDIVDGAARVMDPIFDGINTGKHWCGKFLKDYFPIDW